MNNPHPYISDSPLAHEFWSTGKSVSCPIYDLHGHMGDYPPIYMPKSDPASMIETMDDCGVKVLVFSHHLALLTPDLGNQASIEAVRQYPDRLRSYMVFHPKYPDIMSGIWNTYEKYPDVFVGLKLHPDIHEVPLSDPRFIPAFDYANAHELIVLSHTWGTSIYNGYKEVYGIAREFPRIKLLLGHCLHAEWQSAAQLAHDFPNVYLELTAVFDDRGAIETLVSGAGSDKVIFGTDLPWFDPHHAIGALLSADITDEDLHNIFHRNAERLLAPYL